MNRILNFNYLCLCTHISLKFIIIIWYILKPSMPVHVYFSGDFTAMYQPFKSNLR